MLGMIGLALAGPARAQNAAPSPELLATLRPCRELRGVLKLPDLVVTGVPSPRDERVHHVTLGKRRWIASLTRSGAQCTVFPLAQPNSRLAGSFLRGEAKVTVSAYVQEEERHSLLLFLGRESRPLYAMLLGCLATPRALKLFDGRDTLFVSCISCGDTCQEQGQLFHAFDRAPELVLDVNFGLVQDCDKASGWIRAAKKKGAAPILRVAEAMSNRPGEVPFGRVGEMTFDATKRKFVFSGQPRRQRLPDPCPATD
jgi:hypothetical protein